MSAAHAVRVTAMAIDLARAAGPMAVYERLREAAIEIDVLVTNAGAGMRGAFTSLPIERQMEMIQLNVSSLTELTGLLLPGMIERRRGGVLNVGSTAGFQPGPLMAVYYASKAYVVSFTEALADELAGSGLRVTCLAPGPTATGFAAAAGATTATLFKGDVMNVDDVARVGYEGWKAGRSLVIAGRRNRLRAFAVRLLPRATVLRAVRQLNT
jgi:short-subunit dehydrogenase